MRITNVRNIDKGPSQDMSVLEIEKIGICYKSRSGKERGTKEEQRTDGPRRGKVPLALATNIRVLIPD